MDYREFLANKKLTADSVGFDVSENSLNPMLHPFQKAVVKWALKKGRCALFEDCGLGKTPQQLEWARHVVEKTGRPVLIVAPLAVSAQTVREGVKFGISVNRCKSSSDVKPGINITNYERLADFSPDVFSGVVLDESSILKSYMGKTKQMIIEMFQNTPFRLSCTATPAPNDYLELGNQSQFLGVMPSSEMMMRWFLNDTMNMGKWRLKAHGVEDFWRWVSSWATCMSKPSDLGYCDDGFILPALNFHKVVIAGDWVDRTGNQLFKSLELSATNMHKELRSTAHDRAVRVQELVQKPGQWLIWCNANYEADELARLIPEAHEVRGSDSVEKKERELDAFSNGETRILITKPSIAGFGMNWQNCHQVAFVGLSYSYEQLYQAIRRCWRFGQEHEVDAYLVMADTEKRIHESVVAKEMQHREMEKAMIEIAAKHSEVSYKRELKMDYDRNEYSGRGWRLILGDSIEEVKTIKSDSVGFTVFSPPFSQLYIYSDSVRDMGNCADDEEFFTNFRFLIPELLRVTMPGRLCAVHCKQLVNYKGRDGASGLRDFRGEIIKEFVNAGWVYHSETCIWKDPVIEMQRTKSHGLLHKQLCKDSTYSRQGLPDYLVVFRKWSDEDAAPVKGVDELHRFTEYYGDDGPKMKVEDDPRAFSIHVWQRYASPVWHDIQQTDVLNTKIARTDQDEKHICPLQLGVIRRAVHLWTNKGDLVFSPFAGIGSEGYVSLQMKREFIGIELKKEYAEIAARNLTEASGVYGEQISLFD
jgi:hypothetical protein